MAKFLKLVNGLPRMVDETSNVGIYDETITVGNTGVITGVSVTLPAGRTYSGLELEVYLNGQRLEDALDYNFVGSGARTQITFTFDLVEGDVVRFRIDRTA